MIEVNGNIWDWHEHSKVVITTNIGWDAQFMNNMGAGTALEAWRRWPELAKWYGKLCEGYGADTPVLEHHRLDLVFFPVKPLKPEDPAYSWDQKASYELIQKSLGQLAEITGPLAMTLPGAGNGRADPKRVLEMVRKTLGHRSDVALVDRQL